MSFTERENVLYWVHSAYLHSHPAPAPGRSERPAIWLCRRSAAGRRSGPDRGVAASFPTGSPVGPLRRVTHFEWRDNLFLLNAHHEYR